MKLLITMDMNGAAFEEDLEGYEAARILREVLPRIECASGSAGGTLVDVNGNAVGRWGFAKDDA